MRILLTSPLILAASPALAAGDKPFFSLGNTDFVVTVAFALFIGILLYYKVPGLVGGMLDKRADSIKADLDEAKALREEAQSLLATYERKQKEVQEQADRAALPVLKIKLQVRKPLQSKMFAIRRYWSPLLLQKM
jgi:F-type H+-transporting ATPase subunit b